VAALHDRKDNFDAIDVCEIGVVAKRRKKRIPTPNKRQAGRMFDATALAAHLDPLVDPPITGSAVGSFIGACPYQRTGLHFAGTCARAVAKRARTVARDCRSGVGCARDLQQTGAFLGT
jgi:hypothetical protein